MQIVLIHMPNEQGDVILHNVFFAVDVPQVVGQHLHAAAQQLSTQGIPLEEPSSYHITITQLGRIKDARLEKIVEAMSTITGGSFVVDLSGISHFGGKVVDVIFAQITSGADDLRALREDVLKMLQEIGINHKDAFRNYTPHVTLSMTNGEYDNAALIDAIRPQRNKSFGGFEVTDLALKEIARDSGLRIRTTIHRVSL